MTFPIKGMKFCDLTDYEIDDLLDQCDFGHEAQHDPFVNPFRQGSWSYDFWEEGFASGQYAVNPYEQYSFPWEVWLSAHRAKWWSPFDSTLPRPGY